MTVVTVEMMTEIITMWGPKTDPVHGQDGVKSKERVRRWIERHSIPTGKEGSWKGDGYRWELSACPFNPDHTLGEAFIAVQPSGARVAGCQHESCKWGWRELRELYDGATSDALNLTDLGNANRLAERHIDELRYCPTRATGWLAWDGTRWADDAAGRAQEAGKETALSIYTEAAVEPDPDRRKAIVSWAKQSESYARVSSMVSFARTDPRLVVSHDELDSDPWALNVRNGTIDLASGTLRPHSMGDMITKLAPVVYDPDAHSQEWGRFLERILPDDQVRAYVQRLFGCAAVGLATVDALPILYGSGANGKSTLLEAVRKVMGEYALAANPDLLLMSKHREHATEHARLAGTRLVTTIEVGQGRRLNEAIVKQLTGGDRMTGRFMRQDYFEFNPTWLIVMATNHKPIITGADDGIWRRVSLVPFTVTIPTAERDADLRDRLPVESGSAILNWVVEGCLAWRREGLNPPKAVRAATEAYRGESDVLGQFLAECCEVGPGLSELFAGLYETYQIWTDDSGVEAETTTTFGKMLGDRGFPSRRVTKGPNRKKAEREGLRLKPSDPPPAPKSDEASADPSTEREATSTKCVLPPVAPGLPITRVARTHDLNYGDPQGQPGAIGADVVAFDLETADKDQLWSYGERFVRLAGWSNPQGEIETSPEVARLPTTGVTLVGHNVFSYDLLALARYHALDLTTVEAIDTKLLAFTHDPPEAKLNEGQIERRYSLDSLGERLFGIGKAGDLKKLARQHGGFDQIPVDDPEYVAYLRRDVELTGRIAGHYPMTPYAEREHSIARVAAVMSLSGFRVDEALLGRRLARGEAVRAEMLEKLKALGLPSTKKDGKACAAPHATEAGRAAIVAAFEAFGVTLPLTPKGTPALGQETMALVAERHPEARALAETVKSLNGIRSVYQTVADCLAGDRVHPMVNLRQATGRWSVTRPGLTVMGKRGGRYVEREIFLAEEGEVLIAADLSQVDARAIAALSGDRAYLALFEPGIDAHAEVARAVWGDEARREDAKAIGHGWNYGMGIEGLSRRAAVSIDVAHQFDQAMRERFPDLVRWRSEVRRQARAGELLDNGFGRMMRPDPERAHTQGPALMGQGCARDILMQGLLRLPRALWCHLRAVVHDEIVLSVPIDIVGDVERDVVRALSFPWAPPGSDTPVQIVAGLVGRGDSWGAVYAKEVKT